MNKFYSSLSNLSDLKSKFDECSSFSHRWREGNTSKFGFVLLLCSLLLSTGFGYAQSTANYVLSTNTTSSLGLDANGNTIDLSTGTTPLVTFGSDQGVSPVTNIGFNYNFYGNSFSQFSVSANGILQLGSTAVSGSTYVASGGSVAAPKFSAIGSDAITASLADGGGIISKTVGSAPNRCLVVQWVSYLYWLNSTGPATFQVRLYESTGVVEYVYGQMPIGATTYSSNFTTGFSVGSSANQLASVTTSTNSVSYTTFSTNAYVAATNIPNLHSAAEGTRRNYTFTPPSTVNGDVTDLAFTAVLATGATVNWIDNTTNEFGFVVTRATDAAFTQNLATFAVPSTSSVTTGSPYTLVQSAISAGTTFYYKVVAAVEAGLSTGLSGNVTTLDGATYYWTGLTGGTWNTFSNWNTAADGSGTVPTAWATSDVHIIDGAGTVSGGPLAISVDRTSFTIGQFKVIGNTDLTLASSATTTRTITIAGGPNEDFMLENGSALNLVNATNAIAFAFSGSGNTGVIAGTYTASGSTSNAITVSGATGTLVKVTSTGVVTSNLNSSSAGLVGSITTLLFENGSNYIHANSTTSNYIPTATWMPSATATLNGNTTGTSLISTSTSLGNLIINTTLSTVTFSAFTSTSRIIQGNLTINSTGTGRFRAVTSGVLQVLGNLTINGGIFEVGSSTGGGVIVKGNTTVATGTVLDLNQSTLQNEGNLVNNGSILSSETTTTNSTLNFLGTTVAQTLSGSGTFTGRVSSFGLSNPFGLTISAPVLTQRVNLFYGAIVGSSNITIGTGLDLAAAVQVGSTTNTTSGGSFDVSPTFNLGTGAYSLLYLGETTPRTTGSEVPPSRIVNNVTVNNANGLTISGGIIQVLNGLTLTNGIVTTTLANHIKHGSATAAGTLTGGSTTSYVNGPLVRTIANGNTAFVLFPVGKSQYAPVSLAPTTTDVAVIRAETFDSNSGTASPSIINLSANRRWETALVAGTFTDVKVRVADASIVSTNIPVQAPSAAGAYTSLFGSTASFTAGTPNVIESSAAVTADNFTGFLSFADSNSCVGTPTPGNTIASANAICLGSSVALSLQNLAVGSGITYQWKSSTDGVTYTNIVGATNSSLTVTPLMVTYYQADVTCATGSLTGTSTPVQITFSNAVLSTTPGTRCGEGSVTLAVTGNAGSTINWYGNSSGGAALASGNSFNTPTIEATTTYFAASESAFAGSVPLGAGTLSSSSVGISFLSGGWGGVKTQYIIKASELIAAGIAPGAITSLGFEPTTSGQTYTGFSVNIGATAQNAMTTTFIATGLSQVYLGTLANDGFLPVANTVNTLTFGTGTGSASSFIWNGTSNIVVSISRSSVPSATNSTGSTMKYDATGFTSTAYDQADSLTPAAMLASATADATTGNRPRFILNGQVICSSPRVAVVATVTTPPVLTLSALTTTICNASSSTAIMLTSNPADYDTYVWSPATGVSGNSITGWIFNPTASTLYTLTASQSTGTLCAVSTDFNVVVNPIPAAITFTTTATEACLDTVLPLTVSGGTLSNVVILQENFNGVTNNWTATNASVGGTPAAIAWTLQNSPYPYASYGNFVSNDASKFYMSNNDAGGNGSIANTALISPSFSTAGFADAQVSFWHYFRNPGDAKVEYSINNGTTWTTIQTTTATTGASTGFVQQIVALPAAAVNQAAVKIRFKYDTTGWQYFWAIDNVAVTGTQVTSITWSPVANLFSDATATTSYVAGTAANTVYFKSNAIGENNFTVTATTNSDCFVTATKTITTVDCAIPYVNLQFPGNSTIGTCVSPTYYAQVYKAGVTEALGQGAGIQAWIGKNTTNTDPSTWAESSWQLATFNVQAGNNDEYQVTFAPSTEGTYYVASRFKFAPGAFVYGGYTSTGGGIWDATNNMSSVLTVQTTSAPTAAAQVFCNAGTVADLMATGTGLQWYDVATSGTALTASTVLTSGNYYVSQTLNACESARTMVAVTVNVTTAPTATAQVFCNAGTVADLMATGTSLQWYDVATNGTVLTASTVLASGNYYVSQTLNDCESARTMVAVTVNVTAAPTAAAQVFCNAGTVADLMASGTGLQWYDVATGGTALTSSTALAAGNYYVSQSLNSCESARTMVAVTINVTAAPTAVAQNFCTSGTVADLVATGTGLQWYSFGFGGDALASTTALATGNYYVSQMVSGCESPRTMVLVTVNQLPNLVITNPAATCGTSVDLTAAAIVSGSDTGLTYGYWADPFGTVAFPNPSAITGSGTFYIKATNVSGCSVISPVVITINVTAAPTGTALQDFTTGQTLSNFTVVGQNIVWYSDATGTAVLLSTTEIVSGVTYYASQTINGCESISRLAVTAGVNLRIPSFEVSNLRYYPNPVQTILTVEYSDTIEGIQLYNMLGQMVYNRNTNASKVTIEMTSMAAGNYIMQVTVKGITKNVKVIKK